MANLPPYFYRYQTNRSRTSWNPAHGFVPPPLSQQDYVGASDPSCFFNVKLVRNCLNNNGSSGYIPVSDNENWVRGQAQARGQRIMARIATNTLQPMLKELHFSNLNQRLHGFGDANGTVFIFRPGDMLAGLTFVDGPQVVGASEWLAADNVPAGMVQWVLV